jgi:hypothetical protein
MPMSRIKCVGLSFLSAIAAELVVDVAMSAADHSGANGLLAGIIGFSMFVIPGWLLSLPLVLAFDRADGWRFWVLGIYGTILGPAIIFVFALVSKVAQGTPFDYPLPLAAMALAIALCSTALYLGIFKHYSTDSMEQTQS